MIRKAAPALACILILSSCGRSGGTMRSNGTLARINGQPKLLEAEQVDTVCADHFCEPNYLYDVNFGRHRHHPAPPAPQPAPPPVRPAPPAVILPAGDNLDYSRVILRAREAWALTQGSQDIVVAVVDTGVTINHPDLRENIWTNEAEANGQAGVDDDGDGYVDDVYGWDFADNRPNAIDDNGHGTHCAGIIGAGINGMGIVGISPHVKIMPLKFLDSSGSGDTMGAINAINYAVAHGANVISNSWGGGGRSDLLNQAIQNAIAHGVLVVAAAGNDSSDNDSIASYPASYPGVIAVASSDQQDNLSYFSNYGKSSVMIAAPGSQILSTYLNNQYVVLSGTSMATPQVSGALALALSLKPGIDRALLTSDLCDTANKIHLDQLKCGRMDVYALVDRVAQR